MIILGTLSHVVIAVILAFFISPLSVMLIFFAKEWGEAKYKVKGSIKTFDKNFKMFTLLFTPKVLVQWAAPALAAVIVSLL